MKLTKTKLKQIIKEEIEKVLKEDVTHVKGSQVVKGFKAGQEKACAEKIKALYAAEEAAYSARMSDDSSQYYNAAMWSAEEDVTKLKQELKSGPCKSVYDKYLQQQAADQARVAALEKGAEDERKTRRAAAEKERQAASLAQSHRSAMGLEERLRRLRAKRKNK